jgi:exopolysaccharide production protein ExoQ
MPSNVAALLFVIGIAGLFLLDRDRNQQTSKALWIAVLWLLINGSRPVSLWLQGAAPVAQTSDQLLEGSPIDRYVYTAIEAAGLLVLIARRQRVGAILKNNAPIILFFSYCAMSALWSDYPDVALKRWSKGLGDVEMGLLVLTDPNPVGAVKRLLTRMAFVLMPLSVLFIKYYPELGRVYNRWTWTPSFTGVTGNKNELGMICLVAGLGSIWRILLVRREEVGFEKARHLTAHIVLLAMIVWLLSVASSTTSLSCLLMGSGLLVVTNIRAFSGKTAIVNVLVVGMISLTIFALFVDPGGSLLEGMGKDPTLTGRTDIWKGLVGMVGNPMIGAGYESFWLGGRLAKSHSLMWRLNEAHNGYLEIYLNLGWVGVTLLALVIVSGYRHAIAAVREYPDMGRLRMAYFGVAVVYSLTEAGFRMTSPIWIMFLLMTMDAPYRVPLVAVPVDTRRFPEPRVPLLNRAAGNGSGRKPIEALRRQSHANRFRLQ